MKKKRYSEEQIIGIIKENEAGISVEDLARKHDVADQALDIQMLKDINSKNW